MTAPEVEFSRDDIFVLGNIASMAVMRGLGEQALPIIALIQKARPANAGGFLLEAMYLYSIGACGDAIRLLEESGAFQAAINRDEAVALHLFLLQQDGQIRRASELGQAYLDEGLVSSEVARESIRVITFECQAALGLPADGKGHHSRHMED